MRYSEEDFAFINAAYGSKTDFAAKVDYEIGSKIVLIKIFNISRL